MKVYAIVIGVILTIIIVGKIGLVIKPAVFPAFAEQPQMDTIAIPKGLPAPVERFYRVTYGDRIPLIKTALISGRGSMRIGSLSLPIRFRFAHEVGQNYRHDVDIAFFGLPLTKGLETYIDGRGWGKTPGGIDEGTAYNQGCNVSVWAEALNWFPAVLLTDSRVHWQAVDDATALLMVPFGTGKEVFVVRFDSNTGKVQYLEAMKYNSAKRQKMLWIGGTWFHEGKPWINLQVEETLFNVDVYDYIRSVNPDNPPDTDKAAM